MFRLLGRGLLCAGGAVLVLQLSGVSTTEGTPENALVLLDVERKFYASQPCLERAAQEHDSKYLAAFFPSVKVAVREARERYYKPEPACRDGGGFQGASIGIVRELLVRCRVLKRPSRWNPDGTWKW